MKKLTYFDVECSNQSNHSICQVGLYAEDFETREPVLEKLSIHINPEDGFDPYCVRVNHISKELVANCPTFPEVWPTIAPYFENAIVVGYNVKCDLLALAKSLHRYGFPVPTFYYYDMLTPAKQYFLHCKLGEVCDSLGITMDQAHDALSDAYATAEVCHKFVDEYDWELGEPGEYHLEMKHSFRPFHPHSKSSKSNTERKTLPAELKKEDIAELTLCLSGDFESDEEHKRSHVEAFLKTLGAKITERMSHGVDLLIMGGLGSEGYREGTRGRKHRMAKQFGVPIYEEAQCLFLKK